MKAMLKADCIVVGAGVIGLSIAQKLVSQGREVLVIHQQSDVNTAASYAAGAMLGAFGEVTTESLEGSGRLELEFRVKAARRYRAWLDEFSDLDSSTLLGKGTFIVANNYGRNDLLNIQAIERALCDYSESFNVVQGRDIPGYRPAKGMEFSRALFLPNENFIDVNLLMSKLKHYLHQNSKCSFLDSSVVAVTQKNLKIQGVILSDGRQACSPNVVLASGVGTSQILKSSDKIKVPGLIAGKGVGLTLEADLDIPHVIRTPNRDFACGVHVVPRQAGQFYIGATNRTAAVPGTAPGVTVEEVHDILHEAVHEINTGFESANIIKLACGSRPLSSDSKPIIGQTDIAGLFVATGTYRNGILMAPQIAQLILDLISGEVEVGWEPFSPDIKKRASAATSFRELINTGAGSVVSFIPQPHGKLPYNRSEELTNVLEVLFLIALKDGLDPATDRETLTSLEALQVEALQIVRERPMAESFAQLYYKLHEFKQSKLK